MKSTVSSFFAGDKQIRVYVANTTKMVKDAFEVHGTSPVATAALGRTITAASIMGKMLKGDNDRLTFQIHGSNLIKNIVAVTDSTGNVKGYISDPVVDLPPKLNGKLDVGGAIGDKGKLIIVRDLGLKEPYVGHANLITGEIAEDLAAYYMYSEQQPTAVSLGVLTDSEEYVKAAGGIMIQTLPGIEDEVLTQLEFCIVQMRSISAMINDGLTAEEIAKEVMNGFEVEHLETSEVEFKCDCSRERMLGALISIGEKELTEIVEQDEETEIHCHFCNTYYKFKREEIQEILDSAKE